MAELAVFLAAWIVSVLLAACGLLWLRGLWDRHRAEVARDREQDDRILASEMVEEAVRMLEERGDDAR